MKAPARSTAELMERFNAAFLKHDPSLLEDLIAEDCVIENTVPAPDGARIEGRAACLDWWQQIATAPGTGFDVEAVEVFGDRAILRWRFHWGEATADAVRGVNLMRCRNGLIVEAQGYVKGPQ
jgi:ketosteroid isomerase-like protein